MNMKYQRKQFSKPQSLELICRHRANSLSSPSSAGSSGRRDCALRQGVLFLCLQTAIIFALPALSTEFKLSPLVEISRPNPLAACDDGFHPPGTGTIETAAETTVAVNPIDPRNIVGVSIGGFAQSIGVKVSFDGGRKWQRLPIPGITVCSGGPFLAASDPWISFAPNGDLYSICHPFDVALYTEGRTGIALNKSSDGGLHWSAPVFLADSQSTKFAVDKPSITADPRDSRFVYAVFQQDNGGNRCRTLFSCTTDGGATWEQPRVIYDPGTQNREINANQILVLPDGTLVNAFNENKFSSAGARQDGLFSAMRSTDRGLTWSAPARIASVAPFFVTDPETGHLVSNSGYWNALFATAVDSRGKLYSVWEDLRFTGGQYSRIAFAMSADGGTTWSTPIAINQTPTNIPTANQQAFLPTIAVAADGTIGVTYYDFRNNTPEPGVPTDFWLIHCHPSASVAPTDPANWHSEVRLTERSFDLEATFEFSPDVVLYWLGDYTGLATAGNDFVTTFTMPDSENQTSTFFRRVGP